MAQGHITTNRTRPGWFVREGVLPGVAPATDGISRGLEASVLGRWTRTHMDGAVLQVQAYHTHLRRDETILGFTERSSDIDAQYETRLGARHGLVLGGGYRHVDISTDNTFTAQMGSHKLQTVNAFLQDEIALRPDLALTLGVKLENDTFDDWDLLPSARMMWEASPRQRVWAGASRAHRAPSITDRDFRLNIDVLPGPGLPIIVAFVGNPEYRHEALVQTEAGYRVQIGSNASLDVTAFSGSYSGLPTLEPLAPTVEVTPGSAHLLVAATPANLLDARVSGVEFSAHWTPLPQWQFDASFGFLHLSAEADPASLDLAAAELDANAPAHQWQVRSTFSVRPGVLVGASVSHVGRLRQFAVPAYTRLDARVEWKLTGRLTAAAVGQNLLRGRHQEFSGETLYLTTSVPRSARIDLRWEF